MAEDPLFFPSDNSRLFGVLPQPQGALRDCGFVFCAPFAEEQKQGYRVFVDLARRLEEAGFASLRFDYRGTGDSEGAFTEFSLAGAVRDIGAAAALLRERAKVEQVGLIGLRLGASLAWRAAGEGLPTRLLVLWQPIVDGGLFYRLNIRRMLVRQMMTHGKATGERDTGDETTIDLDGFLASRAMCEEIKALDLRKAERPPAPSLLVQIAHTMEPTAELRPLADKLGADGLFLPIVMEPFWDRLGHVDCTELIEATVAWLCERAH
jgi:pimeloyl-ACP methyl ester carboxylesterase